MKRLFMILLLALLLTGCTSRHATNKANDDYLIKVYITIDGNDMLIFAHNVQVSRENGEVRVIDVNGNIWITSLSRCVVVKVKNDKH